MDAGELVNPRVVSSAKMAVALAAASFGILGACLTVPGTLLPVLVEQFGLRLVQAGSMLALQPVAYLLSVLAASQLISRLGLRVVVSCGLLASAIGFAGFGLMSTWVGGAGMMFMTGLGFGVMEVGINSLLIAVGGERRANVLNFAHLFFGVGSFIGPLLTANAVAAGLSWRATFAVGGSLVAVVAVGWSRLQVDAPAASVPTAAAQNAPGVYSRLAVLLAALLGVYVGVEMGVGGWLTKYMVTLRGATLTYAGNTLSLYWLGLAAGRLALSLVSHRVGEHRLVVALTLTAAVALTGALLVPQPWHAVVCFALAGLGLSGIFPLVVALGGRCHPHNVAGVTSVMIAGAGIGGIVIPWLMSAIADGIGLLAGMVFYGGMSALMVLLAVAVHRRTRVLGC
jgi:fucose permease